IFTHYMLASAPSQPPCCRGGFGEGRRMILDDLEFWFFALLAILVGGFVLAVWALVANRRLRARVDDLTEKFRMVDHRLIRLGEAVAGQPAPAAEAAPPEAPPASVMPAPQPEPTREPEPERVVALSERRQEASVHPARPKVNWEQKLAENWLVWLGGATLALGGAFLVKLSIDYGLLTP